MHCAECDTDHALARVNVNPRRKLHNSKPKGHPSINASRTSDPLKTRELLVALRASLDKGRGKVTNANSKWKKAPGAASGAAGVFCALSGGTGGAGKEGEEERGLV